MNSYRTHTCGELRSSDVNKEVKLAGWIHRKRNLGNLCFVDLRDHYGITQCVFDSSSDLFEKIEAIRPEDWEKARNAFERKVDEICLKV